MKKLIIALLVFACIFFSCAVTEGIDYRMYSTEELLEMRAAINREINSRVPEEQSISHLFHIGDQISFGHYEQDNDKSNGEEPIIWRIISIEDNKALLLSVYALDYMSFDLNYRGQWDVSTMRSFLNNSFFDMAFDEEEKVLICPASISTPATKDLFETSKDVPDTVDKVFLLSYQELVKYLPRQADWKTEVTPFAAEADPDKYKSGDWWLRNNGEREVDLIVMRQNYAVWSWRAMDEAYVRPAIWVDLTAMEFVK